MNYKVRKPDLSKIKEEETLKNLFGDKRGEILAFIKRVSERHYYYWEKVSYIQPSPEGITKEELWSVIKLFRQSQSIETPVKDIEGNHFKWTKLIYFEEFLHQLDMNTGGEIFMGKKGLEKENRQRLITRGIMDEAIASSQLEGAATSRQAAKLMLREGIKPKNRSEQMIVNSYQAMKSIEEEYKNSRMSIDLILELHGLITKDTLDSEGEKPRLRKPGEPICVSDNTTGVVYHEGPEIAFVKKELEELVKFANDEVKTEFIHPVIKAIILHFWLGYLHPFTDGNGRLARLLFYWYLIRHDYWAFVYLPISKVIKSSSTQYTMAYVYTEQDENDLTYFLDYNLRKIKLAVNEFMDYLDSQSKRNKRMKKRCETEYGFNMRQVMLLQYFYGDGEARTTLKAHMNTYDISKATAIKDLKDLVGKGFLSITKQGRNIYYHSTDKIKELF